MKILFFRKHINKLIIVFTLIMPLNVLAAGTGRSELDNPVVVVLLIIIGALALTIGLLGYVVIGAAQLKVENDKKNRQAGTKAIATLAFCLLSAGVFARDVNVSQETVSNPIAGLSDISFYTLITVIALELTVIFWMLGLLRSFIRKEKVIVASPAGIVKENSWKKWWIRINSFRSITEEQQIDMGHDYDDIRELDNKLPPWWLYGFYLTIIFAGIYLWRYHVSHSAPLSIEEYEISVIDAEIQKENSLKKAGNSVDENTVKLLTAAEDINAGKAIFINACAPCHGADGGGIVGPNLVDDYWLHGGKINEVFKTIKYGVPEKGMQPWKGTFSPVQIAQLASFIKSIHGTKVANPKEAQGEIYQDQPATDTLKVSAAVNTTK